MFVVTNLKHIQPNYSEYIQQRIQNERIGSYGLFPYNRTDSVPITMGSSSANPSTMNMVDMRTRSGLPNYVPYDCKSLSRAYHEMWGFPGYPETYSYQTDTMNVPIVSDATVTPTSATPTASAVKANESKDTMAVVNSTEKAQINAENVVPMSDTSSNKPEKTSEREKVAELNRLLALIEGCEIKLRDWATYSKSNGGNSTKAVANDDRMASNEAEKGYYRILLSFSKNFKFN